MGWFKATCDSLNGVKAWRECLANVAIRIELCGILRLRDCFCDREEALGSGWQRFDDPLPAHLFSEFRYVCYVMLAVPGVERKISLQRNGA